ncbi:MAG: carboxylating nicotinate-nucleotide diphosphorylase [Holophagales bacterium]|nr:MAG: carboxylating nicotinate-nucleotide diphosphorylase [Holophagales bacterium]
MSSLSPLLYDDVVRRALAEDLGRAGDLTTEAIVDPAALARASVVARGAGRIAGLEAALHAFVLLDAGMTFERLASDGDEVAADTPLARLTGKARALLSAERTALNLLGRLCGIAAATQDLVRRIEGTRARVADTRKTTPLLRALEKYAVRCGGGVNHRFGLDDAVLIKDNHLAVAGSVRAAVEKARSHVGHLVRIEVEVDTLAQLEEALAVGVEAVLLDNMDVATLRRAVERVAGRAITEASGGVRPETIRAIAETGVDLISVGWLTHSAPALDVALDFET